MKLFGEYLIEKEAISNGQLLAALIAQIKSSTSVPEVIYDEKLLSESDLLRVLALQTKRRIGFIEAAKECQLWTEEIQVLTEKCLLKKRRPIGEILIEQGVIQVDVLSKCLDDFLGGWTPESSSTSESHSYSERPSAAAPSMVIEDCSVYFEIFNDTLLSDLKMFGSRIAEIEAIEEIQATLEKIHGIRSAARFIQAKASESLMIGLEGWIRRAETDQDFRKTKAVQVLFKEAFELAWQMRTCLESQRSEFPSDGGVFEKKFDALMKKLNE